MFFSAAHLFATLATAAAMVLPTFHQQALQNYTRTLESQMRNLWPQAFAQAHGGDEELLIIPKELLKRDVLSSLGFYGQVDLAAMLQLKEAFHVPNVVKPLFLFNASASTDTQLSLLEIVSSQAPFKVPLAKLSNVFMVVAKRAVRARDNGTASYLARHLSAPGSQVPMLSRLEADDAPVLALVFSETEPSMTTSKGVFDTIAEAWATRFGLQSLYESVYCNLNAAAMSNGFCLSVLGQFVRLFPAMSSVGELRKRAFAKRHVRTDLEEGGIEVTPVFETQVIRQTYGRVLNTGRRLSNNVQFLAEDPKQFVKDIDEKVDDRFELVGEAFKGVGERVARVPVRFNEKIDEQIERIQELRQAAGQTMDRYDSLYEDDYVYKRGEPRKFDRSLFKAAAVGGAIANGLPFDQYDLPLSVLQADLQETPRERFRQVGYNVAKRADCDELTWHNVFHQRLLALDLC